MKLPAIPFLTKTVQTEYFVALLFEADKLSGILFKEQNKTLIIIASQEAKVSSEDASDEELISAADSVISRLEVSLPEGATLEKTIFSVPYSWVEEGKIIPEKLTKLKKVSVELALSPVGFVISIEAIVVFLQKKEGAPVNGIFIALYEKFTEIFIVRGGIILEVKKGIIGEEGLEKSVENLLENVEKLEVLPSKIVLLNNEESEKNQQKFLSFHWTKNLPFQHLPQVTILDRGFENEAIINGVASQMGAQIKDSFVFSKPQNQIDSEDFLPAATGAIAADSFGFIKEKDIKTSPQVQDDKSDEDIVVKHNGILEDEALGEEVFEDDYSEEVADPPIDSKKPLLATLIALIPKNISVNSIKERALSLKSRSLAIPVAALVVVALLLIGYYSYILKSQVVIFTDQKAFKDSVGITLTTSGSSSFADKTLRIETVTEEVSGEDSQETTGTLETGEKAKGNVTLYSRLSESKTIPAGTVITSSNGLVFTLDKSASLASSSADASAAPTTASVSVSAQNFGKEFNLPSGQKFTVKGFDVADLVAKNDAAFSGGTKEEVSIVSSNDIQILSDTMVKKLFEKAKKQASDKLGSDDALIPVMLSSDFSNKQFDKKEKDKATSLKLNATISYTLGKYKKEELGKFISSSDNFDIPKDFQLSDKESEISVSDVKQNKNDISAKLSFNAIFKPKIDINKIPDIIKGSSKTGAEQKIKSISGVSDATVILTNKLPLLPAILPLSAKNISVELKTQ